MTTPSSDVLERIEDAQLERIARRVHPLSSNLPTSPSRPSFDRVEDAAAIR